jgi:hypothetical protein
MIDKVGIPRHVAFPAEATRHCPANNVPGIMESCQAGVRDTPGSFNCAIPIVLGHHVNEDPGHAEIQAAVTKKWFERPTSATHT